MDRLATLRQRKADLISEADALSVKDADGTISAEEVTRFAEVLDKDIPAVDAAISREERMAEARRSVAAVATVEPEAAVTRVAPSGNRSTVPAEARREPGRFASLGEQLQAVAQAAMNPQRHFSETDNRLIYQAAPLGANEATPSEGGFLVQSDYSAQLMNEMHEMGELLNRVRRIPVGAQFNGIRLPAIDETSRANGSRFGGVQAYWADEAAASTATKPKFRTMDMTLKKLFGLAYATDELLADTTALEAVLSRAFTEELTFKTEDAIINGTGSGQPLGILTSGALVTITPESGQAVSTIRTENVLKMWARTPIRSRKSLVWLCNQDIEPQLWTLTNPPNGSTAGSATMLLYTPPAPGNAYGQLLGRPVIPIEYAASLGTVGDLMLLDPQQYVMIDKNGVQTSSSIHVAFLTNEQAFRWIFRVDGQPVWRSAVTPFKGSNSLSPYVALGTRT